MKINFKEIPDINKYLMLLLKLDQQAFCRDFDCPFKSAKQVSKYLSGSNISLIYDREKPIGYFTYKFKNKDVAEINGIVVVPEYQQKGIGTKALQKILDDLKNIKKIELTVHPKNFAAIKLYYNFGFIISGWKDNYFGDGQPRLLMEKVNY